MARLISTITSRDGFGRALSRSSLLRDVRGLEETGALALTCIIDNYYTLRNGIGSTSRDLVQLVHLRATHSSFV